MKPYVFQVSFPIFSLASCDSIIVVGGGGGSSKAGVQNKIMIFTLDSDDLILLNEYILQADEDGCMSLALHPLKKCLMAGVNERLEVVKSGVGRSCRFFIIHQDSYMNF